MTGPVEVRVEATPNPNALKFTTNRILAQGRAQTFAQPAQLVIAPLPRQLLSVAGVRSVFLLRDFVTVTREPDAAWEPISAAVERILRDHLSGTA